MKLVTSAIAIIIGSLFPSIVTANILFWQVEWVTTIPGLPVHYETSHYTVCGTDGQTACDAYGTGGTQTGTGGVYSWITNDNYCGRKWSVKGKEFWLTHASNYPNSCTSTAVMNKLPYGLIWDVATGSYQGWCQGMGDDFVSKKCDALGYGPFNPNGPLVRHFKIKCFTSWVSKRDGIVGRPDLLSGSKPEAAAPLPPVEYNITIPASIPIPPPAEWLKTDE